MRDNIFVPGPGGADEAKAKKGWLARGKAADEALIETERRRHGPGRLLISFNNLLSPYAPLMIVYTALRRNYRQHFRAPWRVLARLRRLGCRPEQVRHDTVLGVRMRLAGRLQIPPRVLLPLYRKLDAIADAGSLRYLGFELWVAARKEPS